MAEEEGGEDGGGVAGGVGILQVLVLLAQGEGDGDDITPRREKDSRGAGDVAAAEVLHFVGLVREGGERGLWLWLGATHQAVGHQGDGRAGRRQVPLQALCVRQEGGPGVQVPVEVHRLVGVSAQQQDGARRGEVEVGAEARQRTLQVAVVGALVGRVLGVPGAEGDAAPAEGAGRGALAAAGVPGGGGRRLAPLVAPVVVLVFSPGAFGGGVEGLRRQVAEDGA